MSVRALKKEELESLSSKDVAYMVMENGKRKLNTADLFKKVISLMELPESTFENKVADFYTSLSTDKRFILLDNGKWDLRSNHTSDKVVKIADEEDEEDEEESLEKEEEEEIEEDSFDDTDDEDYDDETNEELKDLVIIDEDELELEV
ncbi:MAG: DNA-directed RNA polymerase subunit delta [Bacilli bacterium]|nr:DNA-directed RNA polymerase subunit delta [Bacilli bacterium]